MSKFLRVCSTFVIFTLITASAAIAAQNLVSPPMESKPLPTMPANSEIESIPAFAERATKDLVEKGCIVGYTDGSLSLHKIASRAEVALIMSKCMEIDLRASQRLLDANYEMLSQSIENAKQKAILASAGVDKPNSVGVSIGVAEAGESVVQLDGRYRAIRLGEKYSISIRPFLNTASELGGSSTVDAALGNDISLYTGVGVVYATNSKADSFVSEGDDRINGFGNVGVDYRLSASAGLSVEGIIPFAGEAKLKMGVNQKF
ncbi:MAG: hypothetical protein ACRCZS_01645 [Chroococcidiopsis sp.]